MWPLRFTFYQFDTVLHLLAAMVLLQHCAFEIRPVHVLGSWLFTLFWFGGLFYQHNEMDCEAARRGRLRLKEWGQSSIWEPLKLARIYMIKNRHIEEDNAFDDSIVGVAKISLVTHIV